MIEVDITRLVPAFILADKNGYALAKAIESMLRDMCGIVQGGLDTILDIDKMPEWRLDEMAQEMNIGWYDAETDIDSKRQQLKIAQEYTGRLGTPAAMISAIRAVFGEGVLSEWFEYGGEPYHYNITTTNNTALTDNRARFLKLVEIVGNVRSVLDNIYYNGDTAEAEISACTCVYGMAGQIRARAI